MSLVKRPSVSNRKSLTHVRSNLLKLWKLGELEGLGFEASVIGAIPVPAVHLGQSGGDCISSVGPRLNGSVCARLSALQGAGKCVFP